MASALNGVSLSQEKTKEIIQRTKEFALLNGSVIHLLTMCHDIHPRSFVQGQGILMRTAKTPDASEEMNYAPFALYPSMVPRKIFEQAVAAQKDFNLLMHRVAHDHDFLQHSLENVIKVDEFTRKLWEIYTVVRNEGFSQKICLGLFRNDLMMDIKNRSGNRKDNTVSSMAERIKLKQIEFNTIASSFAGLVGRLRDVHRYSLNLAGSKHDVRQLPNNDPAHGLAAGLVQAWELYGNNRSQDCPSAAILFLVGTGERNRIDQLWLEERIFQINPRIPVIYRTLLDVWEGSKLDSKNVLSIDGYEVAVIYMRAGYTPTHYPSHKEWEARLNIERSKAIKSPAIHYQLAGTKKIQQELVRSGAVEKYIKDLKAVARIRSTFVEQYSLDMNEEGNQAVSLALERPDDFVLKPQREGGGNNIYGEDIRHFLIENKDSEERSGYILMERIHPWPQKNHLLKVGEDDGLRDIVSEMGIYGVYIGTPEEEYENKQVGHLLRSKTLGVDEGGIVAGFATLDTPLLIE